MRRNRFFQILTFLFLSLGLVHSTGCGSSTKAKKKAKVEDNKPKFAEPQVGGANEIVKKYDLNKDKGKRADLWKVYIRKNDAAGKAQLILIRTEFDLNGDGRIDLRRFYRNNEKVKEAYDLDYDGRFEMMSYYRNGFLFKQSYFVRSKRAPDLFKYFEVIGKAKKKRVVLQRKERDSNLDGRIDYWEYWEGGSLDRIGRDTDYDGNVDVWEKATSS